MVERLEQAQRRRRGIGPRLTDRIGSRPDRHAPEDADPVKRPQQREEMGLDEADEAAAFADDATMRAVLSTDARKAETRDDEKRSAASKEARARLNKFAATPFS